MSCQRFWEPLREPHLNELEAVLSSLDRRYAADWYERLWWSQWPTATVVWLLGGGAALSLVLVLPWWEAVAPYVTWKLISQLAPPLLFKRRPYEPLWASGSVALASEETTALKCFMESNEGNRRLLYGRSMPATGLDVWRLRERAVLRQELISVLKAVGTKQ